MISVITSLVAVTIQSDWWILPLFPPSLIGNRLVNFFQLGIWNSGGSWSQTWEFRMFFGFIGCNCAVRLVNFSQMSIWIQVLSDLKLGIFIVASLAQFQLNICMESDGDVSTKSVTTFENDTHYVYSCLIHSSIFAWCEFASGMSKISCFCFQFPSEFLYC